jgi:hypothetical protein
MCDGFIWMRGDIGADIIGYVAAASAVSTTAGIDSERFASAD